MCYYMRCYRCWSKMNGHRCEVCGGARLDIPAWAIALLIISFPVGVASVICLTLIHIFYLWRTTKVVASQATINSEYQDKVNAADTEHQSKITLINEAMAKLDDQLSEKLALISQEEAKLDSRLKEKSDLVGQEEIKLDNSLNDKREAYNEIFEAATSNAILEVNEKMLSQNDTIARNLERITQYEQEIARLENKQDETHKQVVTSAKKIAKIKEHYKSISAGIDKYYQTTVVFEDFFPLSVRQNIQTAIDDLISPTVEISLHCMTVKQLRSDYKNNQKIINEILERYRGKYTTKANATIYSLMVIGLSSELQNILYTISYGKIDIAVNAVLILTKKYLQLATDGNQNIAPTVIKFIAEIEGLFINAVKIEYEYFVQKERIKEEQRALREQMRQEAEERKLLEQQRKQIEKEESKYTDEISKIAQQLATTVDDAKTIQLQQRIDELNAMLEKVEVEKEKIVSLQNGLAGNIYIISNLGSFGDKMFKIGMTRRIQPQDRIDELGDASVPFRFDVHAMIFTDNAVDLENSLHKELHKNRVNKINNRKEFFYSTIEELQELVQRLSPTAEFNTTMLAEQYRQSQSLDDVDFGDVVLNQDLSEDDED